VKGKYSLFQQLLRGQGGEEKLGGTVNPLRIQGLAEKSGGGVERIMGATKNREASLGQPKAGKKKNALWREKNQKAQCGEREVPVNITHKMGGQKSEKLKIGRENAENFSLPSKIKGKNCAGQWEETNSKERGGEAQIQKNKTTDLQTNIWQGPSKDYVEEGIPDSGAKWKRLEKRGRKAKQERDSTSQSQGQMRKM